VPGDLQAELNKHPKARAFFAILDSTNRYAILFRLQTAKKPETRAKRINNSSACWSGMKNCTPERRAT
jgi:uncharacterized protein YdeI (YjbR/CyaY-like superfamily)